jgi:4-amino-4-deoxy-L-arabinose transferase-like glycosyltransferase
MVLVSLLIAAPWYVHAARQIIDPGAIWAEEWRAERQEFQPPWYYLGLLGLLAPWTVWLIGGLALPFMAHARAARRRHLMPWIWFVLLFVFFSIPGAKQQRYILPIVPAAALLIAQMWTTQQSLADRGGIDPGIDRLRLPHWVLLVATCAAFVPITLRWPELLGPMRTTTAMITATALLCIAVAGAIWHYQWRPMRAFGAMVAWTLVLTTVGWSAYAQSPERDDPVRTTSERLNRYLNGRALGRLWAVDQTYMLNEQFMIHTQRLVPRLTADELSHPDAPPFIMADDNAASRRIMSNAGWRVIGRFEPDLELTCTLWTDLADAPPLDGYGS